MVMRGLAFAFSPGVLTGALGACSGLGPLRDARTSYFRLKSATDEHIPFFTSDDLPHYAAALLAVYGELQTPPLCGSRGGLPTPLRKAPPPDLCYAWLVKRVQTWARGQRSYHPHGLWQPKSKSSGALHDSPKSRHHEHLWRGT